MIRPATVLLALLALSSLAGCTADNLRQGVYEGLRTRNDLQSSPPERIGKPESPDYQTYDRMRREQNR